MLVSDASRFGRPARRRRHAARVQMGGADLVDAFAAVGKTCHAVRTSVQVLLEERTKSPPTFYAKVFGVLLVVAWFGRYWGGTASVALAGSAALWLLSGVHPS